jgi:hypothetical protein
MRLGIRDAVAALLMAAILAPYAILLVRGHAPYVDDVRTMAALAMILGYAGFVVADHITPATPLGRAEIGFAAVTLVLGAVTLVFATTALGQLLLGALVTGILLTWGIQLLDHAGYARDPADRPDHDATGHALMPHRRPYRHPHR